MKDKDILRALKNIHKLFNKDIFIFENKNKAIDHIINEYGEQLMNEYLNTLEERKFISIYEYVAEFYEHMIFEIDNFYFVKFGDEEFDFDALEYFVKRFEIKSIKEFNNIFSLKKLRVDNIDNFKAYDYHYETDSFLLNLKNKKKDLDDWKEYGFTLINKRINNLTIFTDLVVFKQRNNYNYCARIGEENDLIEISINDFDVFEEMLINLLNIESFKVLKVSNKEV